MLAKTPTPPYYAVIFSSIRTEEDSGYGETAERMVELAHQQPGFLGVESARNEFEIPGVAHIMPPDTCQRPPQPSPLQNQQNVGRNVVDFSM